MVARLLRDELIMQLHTFLYLMPPFSHEIVDEFVNFFFFLRKDEKSAVKKENFLQSLLRSTMDILQDDNLHQLLSDTILTAEVKASVIQVYKTMLKQHPQQYVEDLLDLFLR